MRIRIKSPDKIYEYEVEGEVVNIGRSTENDIVLSFPDFSRKQCVLTLKKGYIFIMDPASKNGITVDGKKIPPNRQIPVYGRSVIFLANNFQLILPEGTVIADGNIELDLAYDK